jgi:hypothetical protein
MIEYVQENWVELFAAVGVFLTFATAVAKLTPTPKDDKIVAKVRKVFDFFAVNLGK